MAKKNTTAENSIDGTEQQENGASTTVRNKNGAGMVVTLSPETLASIEEAAENFSTFGLKVPAARDMVAREIERLAAGVSATALFAAEVQAKLAALAAPKG